MLSLEPYNDRMRYPPPGRQWVRFGDAQLDAAMTSISHEAYNVLRQKREAERPFHEERLQKMGLEPPPKPPPQMFDMAVGDVQEQDSGTQTDARPLRAFTGVMPSMYIPPKKALQYDSGLAYSYAPPQKTLSSAAGVEPSTYLPPKKTLQQQFGVGTSTQPAAKKQLSSAQVTSTSYDPMQEEPRWITERPP